MACVVDSGLDFYWAGPDSPLADEVGVYPGTVHPRSVAAVERVYGRARVVFREHAGEQAFWRALGDAAPLMVALSNLACPYIPRRDALPATCHYVLVEGVRGDGVVIHDPFLGHRGLMPRARLLAASIFRTFDGEDVARRTVGVLLEGTRPERDDRAGALAAFAEPPAEWPEPARCVGPEAMLHFASAVESRDAPERLGRLFQPLRYVQYQRQFHVRYLEQISALAPQLGGLLGAAGAYAREAADAWLRIKTLAQYAAVTRRRDCLGKLAEQIRAAAALDAALDGLVGRARAALSSDASYPGDEA